MKKAAIFFLVAMLLVTVCSTAFADEFTPSIENKGAPEIVGVTDDEGNDVIATIFNAEGEAVDYSADDCLNVVALLDAETNSELDDIYNQLVTGDMELPYEKLDPSIQNSNMVIRDLIDISVHCDECAALLEQEGVTVQLTFKMDVPAGKDIVVMTYNDGEWSPIAGVTNNGDGTITCEFEHFCPVAFAVGDLHESNSDTGDRGIVLAATLMMVALCGVAVLAVLHRRDMKKYHN